jgi:hypothetical protein
VEIKVKKWNSEQKKVVEKLNNDYRSQEKSKPDEQYIRGAFLPIEFTVSGIVITENVKSGQHV